MGWVKFVWLKCYFCGDKILDMKKWFFLFVMLLIIYVIFFVQNEEIFKIFDFIIEVKFWVLKGLFGINGSQILFVNWLVGGCNNILVIGFVDVFVKYNKNKFMWEFGLKLVFGGVFYQDFVGCVFGFQKMDD